MENFSKFISDHPGFIFGCFLLVFGALIAVNNALHNLTNWRGK